MRPAKLRALLVVSSASIALLLAKNPWEGSYLQWSQQQAGAILNNSPWAQQQDFTSVQGASRGQNEIRNTFVIRLFSALPIRQAYVRLLQIMDGYETMPTDKQQAFDKGVGSLIHADVHDEVVVTVYFHSTEDITARGLKRFFDTSTAAILSQSAFLYGPRVGRVDLVKYFPPGEGGIGARFVFPRTFKGQPVLQPGDKELRFDFWVDPISQRLLIGFKPSKMMYDGELAY